MKKLKSKIVQMVQVRVPTEKGKVKLSQQFLTEDGSIYEYLAKEDGTRGLVKIESLQVFEESDFEKEEQPAEEEAPVEGSQGLAEAMEPKE